MTATDRDIPSGVLAAFVISMFGWVMSALAGLVVFGNLLSTSAQQDMTDAAAPTILGLAVAPVLGFGLGGIARISLLRDRRLGRSLAWGAVVLGLLGVGNLTAYAIGLAQLEDDLEADRQALAERIEDQQREALAVGHLGRAAGVVTAPAEGVWGTLDGEPCPYELVSPEGGFWDTGLASVVVVPDLTIELRTQPDCDWVFVG